MKSSKTYQQFDQNQMSKQSAKSTIQNDTELRKAGREILRNFAILRDSGNKKQTKHSRNLNSGYHRLSE